MGLVTLHAWIGSPGVAMIATELCEGSRHHGSSGSGPAGGSSLVDSRLAVAPATHVRPRAAALSGPRPRAEGGRQPDPHERALRAWRLDAAARAAEARTPPR